MQSSPNPSSAVVPTVFCDPAEFCDGINDACPDDAVEPQSFECRGSDGTCDPAEFCDGINDACPGDAKDSTTQCRPSQGVCDVEEICDGVNNDCPADLKDSTTVCNPSLGVCDPAEICDGVNNECPVDQLAEQGTVCRESGTGFVICDPPEVCDGINIDCPDEDIIAPPETPCGDPSSTQCTDPDFCDGEGICLYNNKVCGSVTNSSLCQYDMEPAKGTCVGGSEDGGACYIDDPCVQGGGVCDGNICLGGVEDGALCSVPDTDPCESAGGSCVEGQCDGGAYYGVACCYAGGGSCEQSDQFRLLFTPDVQNWVAYKLNASNPGQTFYNLIYDASEAGGSDVSLTVTIPYPYVTVGGSPLHIYDADTVGSNGQGCLDPEDAIRSEKLNISLDDWILGAEGIGDYNLVCDQVQDPGGTGFCSFDVIVLNEEIPAGGLLYVNVHLDYGFKGKFVDANPVGPDSSGMVSDRYDQDSYVSPWGSSDALVNSSTDDGPLAVADCQPYWFEHAETEALAAEPLFEDKLENLNMFKGAHGLFGRVECSDDDSGIPYHIRLLHPKKGEVASGGANQEGNYAIAYEHKGRPLVYTVELASDEAFIDVVTSTQVELTKYGWWEVTFSAFQCGGFKEYWRASVFYGDGDHKKRR